MPLAVSVLDAVLYGLALLALIAIPYWVLYRVFRDDDPRGPED